MYYLFLQNLCSYLFLQNLCSYLFLQNFLLERIKNFIFQERSEVFTKIEHYKIATDGLIFAKTYT